MRRRVALAASLGLAMASASAGTATFKGADLSDPSLAIYVEASYRAPDGKDAAPLSLLQAKVLLLAQDARNEQGFQRYELSCRHDAATADSEGARRQVRGLEGTVLWLDCQPQPDGVFMPNLVVVVREARRLGIEMPLRCARPGALGTRSVALFPIGHQELCLEDWSGQADARRRFVAEYRKRLQGQ